jgi:hypothetical protein
MCKINIFIEEFRLLSSISDLILGRAKVNGFPTLRKKKYGLWSQELTTKISAFISK